MNPEDYDAWYRQPRGAWIAAREYRLLYRLLGLTPPASLLDVGCGTGQFSDRFRTAGFDVTGIDPDAAMLRVARTRHPGRYVQGDALQLPFADASFDACIAVTSLCFVADPARALAEMWRVTRRALVVGVLNRHSLLFRRKAGQGGYRGARWDSSAELRAWCAGLHPRPRCRLATAIFLPGGGPLARWLEAGLPSALPWGGFLALGLYRH